MEWGKTKIDELIDTWKNYPLLYNTKLEDYKDRYSDSLGVWLQLTRCGCDLLCVALTDIKMTDFRQMCQNL